MDALCTTYTGFKLNDVCTNGCNLIRTTMLIHAGLEAEKEAPTDVLNQLRSSVQPTAFESFPQPMQDIINSFDQCRMG